MPGNDEKRLLKIALPFYLFSALSDLAPIYPMYLVMFSARGLDYEQLSILLAVWNIPVILLELPSGVLADRWSKRGVLAIGMALKALAFLAWIMVPGFGGACLGFVLWGCESALCSGSRQALLYETLRSHGREGEYEAAAGAAGAVGTAALLVSEAGGGFVYACDPDLALALSAAIAAAAALCALGLGRSRPRPGSASAEGRAASGAGAALLDEAPHPGLRGQLYALRDAIRDGGLFGILAASVLAGAVFGTADEFDGMWAMERYGVPLAAVGLWALLPFGAGGLGKAAAGRLAKALGGRGMRRLGLALALAGLSFLAAALLPGLWGAAPYLLYYLAMSALSLLFEGRLQAVAPDEGRATLLSFSSLLVTLLATCLSPLFGLAADKGGLGAAFALFALLTMAAALFLPRRPFARGRSS